MSIEDLIAGRAPQNGDYAETAAIAQNIKAAMRESQNWPNLPAIHLEALEMIANKIARILNGDMMHHDHWLDIEGYAHLVQVRIKPTRRKIGDTIEEDMSSLVAALAPREAAQ